MSDFVRFPATPYLVQPDGFDVRGDKVLTDRERAAFLEHDLHVEEKIDGQNLGISCDGERLLFQARGSYVDVGGRHFRGLASWVAPRTARLVAALRTDLVLFGEWCTDTHSVYYDALPDWFLVFDVYDRATERFVEPALRDALVDDLGLHTVPFVAAGRFDLTGLLDLIGPSRVGATRMEGVVARWADAPDSVSAPRAKLVRPDFVQQIDQHWMTAHRSTNRLAR